MSVIAIQAEAGPRKVADPPPELLESFARHPGQRAERARANCAALLGVLRSGSADTAPQPGLAELAGLLDSARSGGVTVSPAVSGHAPGAAAGRGSVRLPDPAGSAEQRDAARAGLRRAGGTRLRAQLGLVIKVRNDACRPARRPPRTSPLAAPAAGNGLGPGTRPPPAGRSRHHRDARTHRHAGRPPGGGPDRGRRVPGHRRPARLRRPPGGASHDRARRDRRRPGHGPVRASPPC